MDEDLATAIYRALALDGEACIEFAQYHSWQKSTERFLKFQRTPAPARASEAPVPELSTLESSPPQSR